MVEVSEPPHFGVGRPRSAAASARPYWVGVKNGFVVTWLTNQNCHFGVVGKLPTAFFVVPAVLLDDEVQAEISAEAAAVALNRPAPFSNLRRAGPSCMLRVSTASSTTGSTFSFIWTSMELSRDTRCPEADPLGRRRFPAKSWHGRKTLSRPGSAHLCGTMYR